jgi:hypothetical protein
MSKMSRGIRRDRNRLQWWPIRLGISPMRWSNVSHHGWQTGVEETPDGSTAFGFMPGLRGVFGHTVTLGPIQIKFGRPKTQDQFCETSIPEGA